LKLLIYNFKNSSMSARRQLFPQAFTNIVPVPAARQATTAFDDEDDDQATPVVAMATATTGFRPPTMCWAPVRPRRPECA
jgi:hypothetical protein